MDESEHLAKADRIDRVESPFTDLEEVRYWLPEVDAIYNEAVRDATIEYFIRYCPEYFLEKPASSTGKYHPPDESGEYGTVLHTKRVFFEYANMSESLTELHQITERERAAGKAAALIHDTFNYGWPSANRNKTTSDHDVIAAAVASQVDGMPEETVRLVHSHMGPWGSGMLPSTENELTFHMADKSAAARNHTQGVYFPPDELKSLGTVSQVPVDDDEII